MLELLTILFNNSKVEPVICSRYFLEKKSAFYFYTKWKNLVATTTNGQDKISFVSFVLWLFFLDSGFPLNGIKK